MCQMREGRALSWLVNSTSARVRLGYHGVWIRYPPLLPCVKELLLLYYVKLHQIFVYSSGSFTASWSHHSTIRIVPGIRSATVQISYMGRQATRSDMFACRLLIYLPMGWRPAASIASTTGGYSHSPPEPRFPVRPVVWLTCTVSSRTRWWYLIHLGRWLL